MKTITKTLTAALALGGAMAMSGCASAQEWRGQGYGPEWRSPREQAAYVQMQVDNTCSGQRGYNLESRLRDAVDRGRVNRWTAGRIQSAIDNLQYSERHECREGDYRSVHGISREYNRISAWIGREAGSPTYTNGNWGGGYWRR